MRVLISGDRNWDDPKPIAYIMQEIVTSYIGEVTFVHGLARGADTMCDVIAKLYNYNVEGYPADWTKHGKAAGPIRNQEMLDTIDPESEDMVIGFHKDIENSKGTKDMLKRSKKKGVKTFLYDGTDMMPYAY